MVEITRTFFTSSFDPTKNTSLLISMNSLLRLVFRVGFSNGAFLFKNNFIFYALQKHGN